MGIQEQIKRGGKGKGSNPLAALLGMATEEKSSKEEVKEGLQSIEDALAAARSASETARKAAEVMARTVPCKVCEGVGQLCFANPGKGPISKSKHPSAYSGEPFDGCGAHKPCPTCSGTGRVEEGE